MENLLERDAGRQRRGNGGAPVTAFVRLSPREREVLQLMAEGRSTKEIATDLASA